MTTLRPLRGRERELDLAMRHLSGGVRVVTLTGMPGVGRSTLAQHIAGMRGAAAPGSVVIIEARRAVEVERLGDELPDGTDLVVIDDSDDPPAIVDAIAKELVASDVRFVVVTRTPLRIAGEQVIRVGPLPRVEPRSSAAELARHPAVQLFTDVASATGTAVTFDGPTLFDVAAICDRLGGLPRAIVLAAARTAAFAPATILELLDGSSAEEVLARKDTEPGADTDLFSTISWSESLLEPSQRQLLREVSTFRGPVPVEAVAAVLDRTDLVDDLTLLVDVHLLEAHHGRDGSRFSLHPLVREHVSRRLTSEDPDRARVLCGRHLVWATATATSATTTQVRELEPDLSAALATAAARGLHEEAAALAVGLAPVWLDRGTTARALETTLPQVRNALESSGSSSPLLPVVMGWEALFRAEAAETREHVDAVVADTENAVASARAFDPSVLLRVIGLAVQAARVVEERDHVGRLCAEGRDLARATGNDRTLARFEVWSGMHAQQEGRVDEAVAWGVSALARARGADDPGLTVAAVGLLRTLPPGAADGITLPSGRELVDAARRAGDHRALVWLLPLAAMEALRTGDVVAAAGHNVELLEQTARSGQWYWGWAAFMNLTLVAVIRGEQERAARLYGMVEPHLPVLRNSLPPWAVVGYERSIERMRRSMGPRFDVAAGTGSALGHAAATADALAYANDVAGTSGAGPDDALLTAREEEVIARLVAGDSNKDVSALLGISVKTVMHHTSNIYRKLDVRGRAEAVAWAVRRAASPPEPGSQLSAPSRVT